jgi:VWFA-related protein
MTSTSSRLTTARTRARTKLLLASAAVVAALVGVSAQQSPQQSPVFRSSVDLIAVDVQVVDRDGVPIGQIGPEAFTVSINGRPRRVMSAEFVRQASTNTAGLSRRGFNDLPEDAGSPQEPAATGRMFILAIDNGSFEPGTISPAIEAAQHFIDGLEPSDRVGLYVYPTGPRMAPTTDRAPVRANLAKVHGEKWALNSRFNLRPSEIIDITAALGMGIQTRQNVIALDGTIPSTGTAGNLAVPADWGTVLEVMRRECPGQADCASNVLNDVASLAPHLENQAAMSLGGLDTLLRALAGVPGRKNVILLSAGVLVSDRRDGRPDVGEMSKIMGQTAARANTSVYTVHIESNRGTGVGASARLSSSTSPRDRLLLGNWLDEFSATAGGTRIAVPVGSGAFAFDRVLRETSAHYLLGVEPDEADRDGLPRQLKVRVDRPGVTVHSRQWVVVPARIGAD